MEAAVATGLWPGRWPNGGEALCCIQPPTSVFPRVPQPIRAAIWAGLEWQQPFHACGIQPALGGNLAAKESLEQVQSIRRYRFQIRGLLGCSQPLLAAQWRLRWCANDRSGWWNPRTARRREQLKPAREPAAPLPWQPLLADGGRNSPCPVGGPGCAHAWDATSSSRAACFRRTGRLGEIKLLGRGIAPAGRDLAGDSSCPSMTLAGLPGQNGRLVPSPVAQQSGAGLAVSFDLAIRRSGATAAAITSGDQAPPPSS